MKVQEMIDVLRKRLQEDAIAYKKDLTCTAFIQVEGYDSDGAEISHHRLLLHELHEDVFFSKEGGIDD